MGKKITDYLTLATILEGDDLLDVSKDTDGAGTYESQKIKAAGVLAGILALTYRSATVSLVQGANVVAFSSILPSASYELIIISLDGSAVDIKSAVKTDAGFSIDALDAGDFTYIAIMTL